MKSLFFSLFLIASIAMSAQGGKAKKAGQEIRKTTEQTAVKAKKGIYKGAKVTRNGVVNAAKSTHRKVAKSRSQIKHKA